MGKSAVYKGLVSYRGMLSVICVKSTTINVAFVVGQRSILSQGSYRWLQTILTVIGKIIRKTICV